MVNVILHFPYPSSTRQIYRHEAKDHFYKLGFPVNAKDGRSHSPLHLACLNNHPEVVAKLLRFKVKIVSRDNFSTSEEEAEELNGNFLGSRLEVGEPEEREVFVESPDVKEATEDMLYPGSGAVNGSSSGAAHGGSAQDMFCPVDIDSLDLDGCTPLHLAVKGNSQQGFHHIAQLLLKHGANPNKPIISPSGNSTALMEACIAGDVFMMDMLLKYKAQDADLKVLSAATLSLHNNMAATLLKYKSYRDSEYKINKQAVIMYHLGQIQGVADTYDSHAVTYPTTPTTINWHALNLPYLQSAWLQEAALLQNPHLISQDNPALAMFAITRIDVSNNNLISIPIEMFTLKSLRLLCISENKIACLPGDTSRDDCAVVPFGNDNSQENRPGTPVEAFTWDLPYLEEIQCFKNKLRTVPASVFKLPSLKRLNLANNELERLPFHMWRAPALLELNLSHNHLRELPVNLALGHQMTASEATASMEGLSDMTQDDSGAGSIPGTPKKVSTSTSTSSSHGSSSSASEKDSNVLPEEACPLVVAPARPYTEQEVEQLSLWKDRLRLRMTIGVTEPLNVKGSVSMLQELNLSHNLFDSLPSGLPCLVPALNKLVLANNRLTHVGALNLYPAGLKLLDLSCNQIMNHVLFESAHLDEDHYTERWATRACYNPSPRKQ